MLSSPCMQNPLGKNLHPLNRGALAPTGSCSKSSLTVFYQTPENFKGITHVQAEQTLIISPFFKNQRETVVTRFSKYGANMKEKYFQTHDGPSTCQMIRDTLAPCRGLAFTALSLGSMFITHFNLLFP